MPARSSWAPTFTITTAFYTAQNTQLAKQGAYQLYNARVSWTHERSNLKLTLFGANLADEVYSFGTFTADFGVAYVLAPTRTYGLRLGWSF